VADDGHAVHEVPLDAEPVPVVDAEPGQVLGRQEGLHRRPRLGRDERAIGECGGERQQVSARRVEPAGGASQRRVEVVRDVDEGTVDDVEPRDGRIGGHVGVGHAQRLGDARAHLVGPRAAGDLLDDVAQHDVVGVGVAVRSTGLTDPSGRVGDHDQLRRRPVASGLADDRRLVEVLPEPAGVVEQLTRRDPVRVGQVGDVATDAAVEVETALVGELQHDDGDERLRGAADVPRDVGVDGSARRVERRRTGTRLADRAVRFAHRDARADELSRGLVLGEDRRQLCLVRRIGCHHGR
jgi:hypothetical protein